MEEIIFFETPGATFGATLAGCLALATASGEAVYFFMRNRRNNELQAVSFQQIQTIVYEEIHKVREGVTIRKPFTAEISFNDDKKIPKTNIHLPLSDRKIFMTYSGMIVCGCDLDEIRFSQDVDNRVKIFVPRSRILDCYADVRSFKVHCQDTGLWAKNFQIAEQNALISTDLAARKQQALQAGILNQANEEIRQELNSIIARHGLNQSFDVEIVFLRQGDSQTLSAPQNLLLRN